MIDIYTIKKNTGKYKADFYLSVCLQVESVKEGENKRFILMYQ